MKIFARLPALISFLLGIIFSILILFLVISTIFDYRPSKIMELEIFNHTSENQILNPELSVLTWNIGYAGLGAEMDFFYDGGTQVRPSEPLNESYLNSIIETIKKKTEVDFILLQEVDKKSKRSYRTNQVKKTADALPENAFSFAKNYDVPFVPVPPTNPMGKVKSGLMSLSKITPVNSERVGFPGNFAWPKNLFMLDRCFLVQRFTTNFGGDLIVVNTHNSAFDDGQLRKNQMEVLKSFATNEFQNGNYVIIGGDWNQNPPGFNPDEIINGDLAVKNDLGNIQINTMPDDWNWAYDKTTPTNRFVDKAYLKSKTPATIIDFFLLSPNIEITSVETADLEFAVSDHNPVLLKFKLKP
jgi:endonuclease/exonuclease/phosphatase family metal-dependent hydrolase